MSTETKRARGRNSEHRGRWAEWLCLLRLWLTGWRIIAQRLIGKRGTGVGEVDIIARRGRTLAFIEVKARATQSQALEAVNAPQRRRIEAAARAFLAHNPQYSDLNVRFDVMVWAESAMPGHIADAWRPE
jgi:putative endonuclease